MWKILFINIVQKGGEILIEKSESIELIKLPTTSYDCFIQQLAVICNFYCGEFHKLIFEEKLILDEDKDNNEKYRVKCENDYFQNIEKFYGITLTKIGGLNQVTFDNNELYFVFVDIKKYSLCDNIREYDVTGHAVVLWGYTGEEYLLLDNYYGIKDFKIEKQKFSEAIWDIWRIDRKGNMKVFAQIDEKIYLRKHLINSYDVIKKVHCILKQKNLSSLSSKILIENINAVFSYINKSAYLVDNICNTDPFLKLCGELLGKVSEQIRTKWYSANKYKIRYGEIGQVEFIKRYDEILKILEYERKIKAEILNLIDGKEGLKERLINQLSVYLKCDVNLNEYVYKKHDGYTILELINYWESENSIQEIDTLIFTGKRSYEDFILALYKEILLA